MGGTAKSVTRMPRKKIERQFMEQESIMAERFLAIFPDIILVAAGLFLLVFAATLFARRVSEKRLREEGEEVLGDRQVMQFGMGFVAIVSLIFLYALGR